MKTFFSGPFPQILPPAVAILKDVHAQFRRFERLPRGEQERIQARQLGHLLAHAQAYSPYWRQVLEAAGIDPAQPMTLQALQRLPILTRAEIQDHAAAMRARHPDWAEADVQSHSTSGSTGQPVRIEKLRGVYSVVYQALSLVDHVWHRRDARKTLGAYKPNVENTDESRWGPPISWFGPVGRTYGRKVSDHTIEQLYASLEQHAPAYVLASPPLVRAFAQTAQEQSRPAPRIEQFLTYSAQIPEGLRELAQEVFGARVVDRYSSEECGWIALQCPKHDHYHVMSAACVLEVVDDAGAPCPPGEPGRVLVTVLHSYAMPLIRYELGDLAVMGPDCDCGITLPVLARIEGRTRDFITLPNGQRRYAGLNLGMKIGGSEVLEHHILLYSCGTLEVVVRCRGGLSEETRAAIIARLRDRLGDSFPIVLRETDRKNWLGLHKRREFERVDRPYAPEA